MGVYVNEYDKSEKTAIGVALLRAFLYPSEPNTRKIIRESYMSHISVLYELPSFALIKLK